MTDTKNSMLILYAAVFLLALNGLFSKLIPLDAVSITQLRSIIAALTLLIFVAFRKRQYKLDSLKQYASVYAIGVILGMHWISFFHAMQVSTVAIGMLSLFTYPMITVLLEPFYNKQKIQLSDIVAALIVLLGVFMMLKDDLQSFDNVAVQGVFWGVVSAFLFALRNILQKYHHPQVNAERLMLHQLIAIALMLILFLDYTEVSLLNVTDWWVIVLLGVISTATAHTLLSYSLKHFDAKTVAMISCLQPFLASLFAWWILNEESSLAVLTGGAIVVSVAFYESLKKTVTQSTG